MELVNAHVERRARTSRPRLLSAALAFLLALTGAVALQLASGASPAAAYTPPAVQTEAFWHADTDYKGVVVNPSATHVPDEATQVRVTVHRTSGGDVVKTSKTTGTVMASIKNGQVTAPIVIQPGSYNEANSSSWHAPVGVVWTAETVPTSVTVDLLAGDTVLATVTREISPYNGVTAADVMPLKTIVGLEAFWHDDSDYKGIAVGVSAQNLPDDATQVRVTIHRQAGGDVVKTSKPTGSVMANIKNGQVTAPIVIQRGDYNEANSGSWYAPVAVWAPDMLPTSVTAEILVGDTAIASKNVTIQPFGGANAGNVMPTSTPPVIVEVPSSGGTYTVDLPAGADEVILELGTPSVGDGEVTIPVEVVVETPVGASVVFAPGTVVSSTDPSWDGSIQLPKVKNDVVVPTTPGTIATVAIAIELGSPDGRIDFDTPVKLVLAGQAGKAAGYVESGTFHAITAECPATVPAGMTTDECWANDGADLVIWTTHFTTFLAYSTAAQLPATGPREASMLLLAAFGAVGLGVLLVVGARRRWHAGS